MAVWIETDHHGVVNLDYIKRIDLTGDVEKGTLGIYLFDVDGNTYPIIDIPRFKNIGVLNGKETDQEIHAAIYIFYSVAKRLVAGAKQREVITIEAIYKEFAAEWFSQQRKDLIRTDRKKRPRRQTPTKEDPQALENQETEPENIHHFSDMKQFLDAYTEIYKSKFNRKPPIHYRDEGKIAKDLVKFYPLERLRTMLQWYFESDEDFINKAQYDMKTFKAILERTQRTEGPEET
jgi:hypothetical protein